MWGWSKEHDYIFLAGLVCAVVGLVSVPYWIYKAIVFLCEHLQWVN